jgi:Protein of unknown function (DUF2934)
MSSKQDLVREKAYAIWLAEGRPHGCDQKHWLAAETEVGQSAKNGGEPKTPRTTKVARATRKVMKRV